jgi:hypothetical protein
MVYNDMPVIIPLLATGYLLTIYLLLMLAQWTMKNSRYAGNSLSDAYASYLPTEEASQKDQVERWARCLQGRPLSRLSKGMENSGVNFLEKHEGEASKELTLDIHSPEAPSRATPSLTTAQSQ